LTLILNGFMKRLALLCCLLIFSIFWGTGLALAQKTHQNQLEINAAYLIADNYEIGQQLYLENCSSCHLPIPPEVLPTETWREILEKPQQHYSEQLTPTISLTTRLMWQYLSTFSRPLLPDESQPKYVEQSRYFKALHPRVKLPKPVTVQTCITCHPSATEFNYRNLTSEWENTP
jgi:hypothetical protein